MSALDVTRLSAIRHDGDNLGEAASCSQSTRLEIRDAPAYVVPSQRHPPSARARRVVHWPAAASVDPVAGHPSRRTSTDVWSRRRAIHLRSRHRRRQPDRRVVESGHGIETICPRRWLSTGRRRPARRCRPGGRPVPCEPDRTRRRLRRRRRLLRHQRLPDHRPPPARAGARRADRADAVLRPACPATAAGGNSSSSWRRSSSP